jgi:hypothetical protein
MAWIRIRLELARSGEFPEGSNRHGYELLLPLDATGRLDRRTFRKSPELCTVHRFWEGEGDSTGMLRLGEDGRWLFSFDSAEPGIEAIPRLADHRFRDSEYLSICEPDGRVHTFRVVHLRPATEIAEPSR